MTFIDKFLSVTKATVAPVCASSATVSADYHHVEGRLVDSWTK